MIKSLSILNYQSHEKSRLEFAPGVNVIVGVSDSGKTAIIRALRWLSWNRPAGNSMCSNWGGDTTVLLETEEGFILRHKGTKDKYELKRNGRRGIEFKAFGSSVPDEITSFLNVNEINLQRQLDSHFLLSKSPGEVASFFNKIAKLDKIDLGIQNTQKEIRRLSQEIAYQRSTKVELKKQLEKFEYLDKVEVQIEVLEEADKKRVNLQNSKKKLMGICESYYDCRIQIDLHSFNLELEKPILTLLSLYEKLNTLKTNQQRISDLIDRNKEITEEILESQESIKTEKLILTLLQLYKDKEIKEQQRTSLSSIITVIRYTKQRIKANEDEFKRLSIKFKKEFPDICPLCGNKIKK